MKPHRWPIMSSESTPRVSLSNESDSTPSGLDTGNIQYRLLRISSERFARSPKDLNEEEAKEVRTIAAKEYLIEQAVLSTPEASDVVIPQSQVEKAAEQIAARYEDEADFFLALEENQLRFQDLLLALERELRVEAVMALVAAQAPEVSDTEVNLFYYLHRDKIQREEMRQVRHILVTINPDFEENSRENVEKKIGAVLQRVRKKSNRFAEQAMKHSECPTAMQGGMLGEVKRGTLYPELDEVLFKMRVGEISDVIESPVGLHILFCESITPAGEVPLHQIMDSLREQLQEKERTRYVKQWIQQLLQAGAETETEVVEECAS